MSGSLKILSKIIFAFSSISFDGSFSTSLKKDNKPEFPNTKIRPIQPGAKSAIENMDILVSKILTQIKTHLKYRIGNTADAQDKIKEINRTLPNNYIIVSLDIANMYPTVPINKEALKVIESYLIKYKEEIEMFGFKIKHIIMMLEFILNNTYIKYKNKYYIQMLGVGTGLRISCSYAEIIVEYTYIQAINQSPTKPMSTSNYVDDHGLLIWPEDIESFNKFKDLINKIWPTVKFEIEYNPEKGITFLDLIISKDINNKITYEFH